MPNEEPKPRSTSREAVVSPWTIEADHPRSSDLLIQSVPGCKLRSAIRSTKEVKDAKTGETMVPLDQARHLATFPPLPGMRLMVDPANLSYEISDPLVDRPELLETLRRRANETSMFRASSQFRGVPTQKGTLDAHRMKTLCRELLRIVESGEAKVVAGVLPSLEDIDKLPGNYLLNPGSRVPNLQPTYEKDYERWLENVKSGSVS